MSLSDLLKSHQALVRPVNTHEDLDTCHLRVRRKHLLADTLHRFRCSIPLDKYLKITFLGEPAVDEGNSFSASVHYNHVMRQRHVIIILQYITFMVHMAALFICRRTTERIFIPHCG